MIDSNIRKISLCLSNGIPIKPFDGDDNDKELIYLTQYLREIHEKPNIQEKIQEDFTNFMLKHSDSNI